MKQTGYYLTLIFVCLFLVCSSGCKNNILNPHSVSCYGFDYHRTKASSYSDDLCLRRFFLFSVIVDGEDSEQYGGDLCEILDTIGEQRFVRVLQTTGSEVQSNVGSSIWFEIGADQDDKERAGEALKRFQLKYPTLAKLIVGHKK